MSAQGTSGSDEQRRRHRPPAAEQLRDHDIDDALVANDEAAAEPVVGKHSLVDAAFYGSQRDAEEPVPGKVTRMMQLERDERARDDRRAARAGRPRGRLAAKAQAGRSIEDNRELLEQALAKAQTAGGGTALDAQVAKAMQTILGAAFDNVRIHTNADAAEAARLLGARAFTLGSHIFFGEGEFAPGTVAGDRLLRHELTHVVQHARGEMETGSAVEIAAESSAIEVEARAAENRTGPTRDAHQPALVIPEGAPAPGLVARDTAPAAPAAAKEWKLQLLGQGLDLSKELTKATDNGDGTKTLLLGHTVGPVKLVSARFKQTGDKVESATITAAIESGVLKGTNGSLTVNAEGRVSGTLTVPITAPGMFVKELSISVDPDGITGKAKLSPSDFTSPDFPIKTSDFELTVTRSAAGSIEVGLTGTASVTVENGLAAGAATMAIDLKVDSSGVSFKATITGKVDIKGITEADAVIKYDGKNITFDVGSKIPVNLPGIAGTAIIEFKAGKLSLDSKDLHFTLPQLEPVKFQSVHLEKSNLAAKLVLGSPIVVPLPGGASLSLDKSTIEIDGALVKGDITGTFALGNAEGFSATASLHYEKGGDLGGSITVVGGANVKFGPAEVSIANGSKLTIVKGLGVEGDITGSVKVPGIKAEIKAHVVAKKGQPIDLEVDAKIPLTQIKKELGGDLQVKYTRTGGASAFSFEATNISVDVEPISKQVIFSKFAGKLEGKEITGSLEAKAGTIIKAGGATVTIQGGHVQLLPGGKLEGSLQAKAEAGGGAAGVEAKIGWKNGVFEWSAEAVFELSPLTKDVLRGKVRAAGGSDGSGKFKSEGPVTFGSPALEGIAIEEVSGDKQKGEFVAVISAGEALNKLTEKIPGIHIGTKTAKAKIEVVGGKVKIDGKVDGDFKYPKTGESQLEGDFHLGMSPEGGFTGKVDNLKITASEYFKSKGGSADLETGIVDIGDAEFTVPGVATGKVTANIDLNSKQFDVQADVDMTVKALQGVKLKVAIKNNELEVKMREGTPPIKLGFAELTVAQESEVKLAKGRGLFAHLVGTVSAKGLGTGKFDIKYENKKLSGEADLHIEKFAMFDPVDVSMKLDEEKRLSTKKPIVLSLAAEYATMFEAKAEISITDNKFRVKGTVDEVKNLGKISEAFKAGQGGTIEYADGAVTVNAEVDVGGPKVIPELDHGSILKLAYGGGIFSMMGTLKPKGYGPVKCTPDSHITAMWTSVTKRLVVDGEAHADIANLCKVDFTVKAGSGSDEPGAFALKGRIDATKLAEKIPGISFSSVTADFSVLIGSGKQADLNFHFNAQINGIPAAGITDVQAHIDADYTSGEGFSGELAVTRAKIGDVEADGRITVAKNKFSTGELHVKAAFPALTIEGTGIVAAGEMNDLNTTADLKVTPGGGSALASFVESGSIHVELKKWKLAKAVGKLNLKPPSFLPIENPVVEIGYTPETGISATLTTQFNAPMAKNGEKGTFTAGYQRDRGLFAHIEFPLTVPGFEQAKFTGDLDSAGIRAGVTLVPKDAKIIKQAKIEIGYDFKTGLFVQGMLTLTPTESLELDVGVRYDGKGLQIIGMDSKDKDATSEEHEVANWKKKFPTIPLLTVGVASLGLRFSLGVAAGYRMPKVKFKNPQLEGGLDALEGGGMPAFTFGGSVAMGAYVSLALAVEVVGEIQLLIASCSVGLGAEIMARLNLELGADVDGRFAPGQGALLKIDPFVGASLDLIASLIATLYAEVCWFTIVDKKATLASATFAHIDLPAFRPFKPLGIQFGGPGGTQMTQGLELRDDAFDQITEGVKEGGKNAGDEEANKDAREKVRPVLAAFQRSADQFAKEPEGWQNGMTMAPVNFTTMFPVTEKEWDFYQDNADRAEDLVPEHRMDTPSERLAKAVAITARRNPFAAGALILAWRRAQIAAMGVNPDTGVNVLEEREKVQAIIIAKYELDLAEAQAKQAGLDAQHASHVARQSDDYKKATEEHHKAHHAARGAFESKVATTQAKWNETQQKEANAAKAAQQEGAPVKPDNVDVAPPPPTPPPPAPPKPLAAPAPIPVPAPVPLPAPPENLPAITKPALPEDPGVVPTASMTIAPQRKPAKVESPGAKEAPKGGAPNPQPGATSPTATQAAGGGGGAAMPAGGTSAAPKGGGGGAPAAPAPGPAVMAGPEGIISQDKTLDAKETAATGKPPEISATGAAGGPPPAAAPPPAAPAPAAAGAAPAAGPNAAAGGAPAGAPGAAPGAAPDAAAKGADPKAAAGGPIDPTVKAVVDAGKADQAAYKDQLKAQQTKYNAGVSSKNKAVEQEQKKLEADAAAAKVQKEKQAEEKAAAAAQGAADAAAAPAAPTAAAPTGAAPTVAPGAPAPTPGAPAPAVDPTQLKEADDKIRAALLAAAVPPATLASMAESERIALGAKPPVDVRKHFYADWTAFVGALSSLQKTKTDQLDTEQGFEPGNEALVPSFKEKALASFHAEGKDISAMFTSTARGGFQFKGKKLSEADLAVAVPPDKGVARVVGSGAVEGQIKLDVAKTDWLAANPGKTAPAPEVLKAWAMEQIKATPKKIETYTDGPALVKYPGWVFPEPDIKSDAVFSEYCDLLALYANWYPQGHIRMTVKSAAVVKKVQAGELRKPTVFDGMQSPLWVQRDNRDHNWGKTGGGLREALMQVSWDDVDHDKWVVVQTDAKYKAVLDAYAAEEAAKKDPTKADPDAATTLKEHQAKQLADAEATQAAQTAQDAAAKAAPPGASPAPAAPAAGPSPAAPTPDPTPPTPPASAAAVAPTPTGAQPGAAPAQPVATPEPPKPEPPPPPPVPKTMIETSPATLERPAPTLAAELATAQSGMVIYQAGAADPGKVTESLLANHPTAKLDASGTLTLPPVPSKTVDQAASLVQLGQAVAAATGVSRVTITKIGDKFIVIGHINPSADVATITRGEPQTAKEFEEQYSVKSTKEVKSVSVTRLFSGDIRRGPGRVPMEGTEALPGYVVNMATTPGGVTANTVSKYAADAWSGSDPKDAPVARTGVVVGVNAAERLHDAHNATATDAITKKAGEVMATQPKELSVGAVGFTWRPDWKHVDKGDVGFDGAKKAFDKLPDGEKGKVIEDAGGEMKTGGQLPYGIFREEVLGSSATKAMVGHIGTSADPVHIVSQDADGQVGAISGKGVLAAYDEFLRAPGVDPLLTIGGYNFEGLDWTAKAPVRAAQLTKLANEIDRAIRAAIAKLYPEMLYPSEPNALIKAQDKADVAAGGVGGIFDNPTLEAKLQPVRDNDAVGVAQEREGKVYGIGATEGVVARNNIGAATPGGIEGRVAAPPGLSIPTSPEPTDPNRGLTVTSQKVRDAEDGKLTQDGELVVPLIQPEGQPATSPRQDKYTAISTQSQSNADPRTLAREFRKGTPELMNQPDDGKANAPALNEVFQPVEAAGRALVENPGQGPDSPAILALQQAAKRRAELEAEQEKHSAAAKAAFIRAGEIAQAIIAAMAAPEMTKIWNDLKTLLAEIKTGAEGAAQAKAEAAAAKEAEDAARAAAQTEPPKK